MTETPDQKSLGVSRLKALLFEPEHQQLDEVARRLDEVAAQGRSISARVDAVFERAGSGERLQKSVAEIIDGALRDAEVHKHEELSQAVAPLVVRTIKYELKNSQDEMVEALYPITGKLVKQYVQAAVADMMADINRRLGGGQRNSDIEARATAQGVSVAELILSETQALKVDELFLVRRGSGDLVAHWELQDDGSASTSQMSGQGSNRDVLIAGYLSGITSFSEEAFDDRRSVLRTIDLNGERIFVRASPVYLLAARCSGRAPVAVEQVIDDEFLKIVETYKDMLADPGRGGVEPQAVHALLPGLAQSLETRFEAQRRELEANAMRSAARGNARLYVLAAALVLPLLGWFGWSAYDAMRTSRTRQAVQAIVGATSELEGYPISIDVAAGGAGYRLTGLAPTVAIKDQLGKRLETEVPWARARNELSVVAAGGIDETALRRSLDAAVTANVQRLLDRASERAAEIRRDVAGLGQRIAAPAERQRIAQSDAALGEVVAAIDGVRRDVRGDGTGRALVAARTRLADVERAITAVSGASATAAGAPVAGGDAVALAENLVAALERLGGSLPLIERTLAVAPLQRQVGELNDRLAQLAPPTPRQRLEAWARSHAIFFRNGTEFDNPATVEQELAAVPPLLNANTEILRVVGYTDERAGASTNNLAIAQARADRIVAMLIERGVPRDRLVAVGRSNGTEISRASGPGTANRRVEFEVGFVGEPVQR